MWAAYSQTKAAIKERANLGSEGANEQLEANLKEIKNILHKLSDNWDKQSDAPTMRRMVNSNY